MVSAYKHRTAWSGVFSHLLSYFDTPSNTIRA
jgi:hypothetical protein